MANISRTKVITGKDTRLSYFNGWEPKSINGGPEKYSVSLLIPKDDKETINAIEKAIDAAIEEGIGKFGGKKPNKAAIKLPLRDGDIERDDEAYKGHYFINANSVTAPQIVDKAVKPSLIEVKYIQVVMLVYPLAFMLLTQMVIRELPAVLETFKRLEMVSHLVEEVMLLMISQALKMMTS